MAFTLQINGIILTPSGVIFSRPRFFSHLPQSPYLHGKIVQLPLSEEQILALALFNASKKAGGRWLKVYLKGLYGFLQWTLL